MALWKFQCLMRFTSHVLGGAPEVMSWLDEVSCVEPLGNVHLHSIYPGGKRYYAVFDYVAYGKTVLHARENAIKFTKGLADAWTREGTVFHGWSVSAGTYVDVPRSPNGRYAWEDEEQ